MRIKNEQGSNRTPRCDVQAIQAINYPRPFIDCQMSLLASKAPCEKPVFVGSLARRVCKPKGLRTRAEDCADMVPRAQMGFAHPTGLMCRV